MHVLKVGPHGWRGHGRSEREISALSDDPHYVKALQRRAASNEKIGTWSSLTSAQEGPDLGPSRELAIITNATARLQAAGGAVAHWFSRIDADKEGSSVLGASYASSSGKRDSRNDG